VTTKFQALVRGVKRIASLVSETFEQFARDHADLAAGALAFFTLLSMAPLIIIAVATAGFFLGREAARAEMNRVLIEMMGRPAAEMVNDWVTQAGEASGVASVVGTGLLLFTASRLAAQLREALNQVWNVDIKHVEGFKATVRAYVLRRASAFVVILASGPLLLCVFASRTLVTAMRNFFPDMPGWVNFGWQLLQFGSSLIIVGVSTALVFRFVPDTRMGWRPIWVGAGVTSLLFNLGSILIGLYLGRSSMATYGLAGSLVAILFWLYYSGQIFLLGAEFTQVFAKHYGSGLKEEEERELQQVEEVCEAPG